MRQFTDKHNQRRSNRRGAAMVMAAILLPILIALPGFAIDLGMMHMQRVRASKAMDATALSLVQMLQSNYSASAVSACGTLIGAYNLALANLSSLGATISVSASSDSDMAKVNVTLDGVEYTPQFGDLADRTATVEQVFGTVEALAYKEKRYPLMIALVLDASGSMAGKMEEAKDAAQHFVGLLKPHLDAVAVISFEAAATLVFPMDIVDDVSTTSAVWTAIESIYAGGATNMAEGIALGRLEIVRGTNTLTGFDTQFPNKVMIVLGDGAPNYPLSTEASTSIYSMERYIDFRWSREVNDAANANACNVSDCIVAPHTDVNADGTMDITLVPACCNDRTVYENSSDCELKNCDTTTCVAVCDTCVIDDKRRLTTCTEFSNMYDKPNASAYPPDYQYHSISSAMYYHRAYTLNNPARLLTVTEADAVKDMGTNLGGNYRTRIFSIGYNTTAFNDLLEKVANDPLSAADSTGDKNVDEYTDTDEYRYVHRLCRISSECTATFACPQSLHDDQSPHSNFRVDHATGKYYQSSIANIEAVFDDIALIIGAKRPELIR